MISESEIRMKIGRATNEGMRRAAGALQVVQRQQWQRAFNEGGQPSERWPDLWANEVPGHFRAGGQPLRDTGTLAASGFIAESEVTNTSVRSVWASALPYAPMHQEGFHTTGPNFIPLTTKARRMHKDGAKPSEEGLEEGVDYIMAWAGVDVPPRPMIAYEDPVNREEINETVADAMKG